MLSILLIENNIVRSKQCDMFLAYDNYEIAQQIKVLKEVSEDIAKKYQQIYEMTQMNIDICQSIEEGAFK